MKLTDLQANDLLATLKTVDGTGSGLDTDKVRGTNPFTANKNKIINGDIQVAQRGRMHYLENDSDYTIDRVKVTINDDNAVEVRQEVIYSPTEGSLKDTKDPFGDDSEIAFYKFEDNADDEHGDHNGQWKDKDGNDIDGTYDNGKFGKGAKFDGESYIDIGSLDSILSQNSYTITGWLSWESDGGTFINLRNKDSDGSSSDCKGGVFIIKDEKLQFTVKGTDDSSNITKILDVSNMTKVFNFVVISHNVDNKAISLHINNEHITTINYSGNLIFEDDVTGLIGVHHYSDDIYRNYFNGIIDQVRIFNKILSEDEIRKLYVEDSKYITKTHMRTNLMQKRDTYTVTLYEYRFEGQDIVPLMNDKAVLSFNLASSKNQDFTVRLKYPDGSEFKKEIITYDGNKEFTKHSVVFDMADLDVSKISIDENLGLILTIGENDELDVGDFIRLTDVQLEVGKIATEFERISYDIQLDKCMRYFEKVKFHKNNDGTDDNKYFIWDIQFMQIKRNNPSLTVENLQTYQTDTSLEINSGYIFNSNLDKRCGVLLKTSPNDDNHYVEITGTILVDAEL